MKYFWIFIGALLTCVGDVLLKRWSLGKTSIFWGMLAYVVDALVWAKILKDGNDMSSSMIIWETMSVILVIAWVVYFEEERLSNTTWIGMLVAVAGIALMEYGSD